MDHTLSMPDAGLSAPGIAMIVVLAICFIAEVALVVSLPAVQNFFRRVLHLGAPAAHPPTRTA